MNHFNGIVNSSGYRLPYPPFKGLMLLMELVSHMTHWGFSCTDDLGIGLIGPSRLRVDREKI